MDRTIRVTGTGKISVRPDLIRLNISMSRTHRAYKTVMEASVKDKNELNQAFEQLGLDSKELKTSYFRIEPEYKNVEVNGRWQNKFIGYRYRHDIVMEFNHDNAMLARVLEALLKCDSAPEFSFDYDVKDMEAVKTQLIAKAVKDSRTKALALTEAAGVTLGEVVNIDYSWGEVRLERNIQSYRKMAAMDSGAMDMNIEAEDITAEDTVTVIWTIS